MQAEERWVDIAQVEHFARLLMKDGADLAVLAGDLLLHLQLVLQRLISHAMYAVEQLVLDELDRVRSCPQGACRIKTNMNIRYQIRKCVPRPPSHCSIS